ncbi:hypothetical protein [Cellulosimicrobium arenosum]|uniref:Uncharacterized protein n=1 Tax=Cellulosimicrobium arenosum TaxID=2708133 RepID=A0A927PG49_9MICO|nr:hypothetical protein [Cellulosimicrobium arenosum]MBD8080060.1 hypothetical protein [Cellulosimicrobium arenosum]
MEGQSQRLARHVAEVADAWLRDPLDAGVYRRLVDATLAWRAHEGLHVPDPPSAPGPGATADHLSADDPAVLEVDDDARFLRPDRAPRRLDGALDGVASMLRARATTAQAAADTATTGDDGPDPPA